MSAEIPEGGEVFPKICMNWFAQTVSNRAGLTQASEQERKKKKIK